MLNKVKLAARVAWFKVSNQYADSSKDYDKASDDYDSFFSSTMGIHSLGLLNKMNIQPGQHVLELACGTGFITAEVANRLNGEGTISTVDQSAGMLDVARKKISKYSGLKFTMHQGDMVEFLKQIPSSSIDTVVCGWAICYTNPAIFLKEVHRVLKSNGQVGIIETRCDSEEILMKAFERVLSNDPTYLKRYISINLPPNSLTLQKWFNKGNLNTIDRWEGEQILPCKDAEDAMEWVFRSGAAAGFLDVLDRDREEEILHKIKEQINLLIQQGNEFKLSHTFVAGVASKGSSI
ncbi:methyltransferase domain-containing protein [Bacillus sp. TH22]|uniref:class I SAM-dependent methyltransferase n=1 Tax=unclassified Bacillus (in: firmicutes) TaxID=185979 RepID=UPI00191341AB|nr:MULTISPECIES: class I SAM-dependent methyltransferase [unclassified Bacillus (in: firmicutes)]MBK5360392.1 methyltransferase domain-containing protein [Bacillus sp. TH44]MBK5345673.1 methyltransferase domain-containing protein [Bacillus sp. TH45]MBK5367286.1 methyltransferase domain-containing protein [Bacillus sp. TH50]MBK5452349.1 methyltransferase domain-containing protein [Bacillus sp. TH22]MBK5457734.1 methyltransferase domain-containing protein [Bacillus sp. TH23]